MAATESTDPLECTRRTRSRAIVSGRARSVIRFAKLVDAPLESWVVLG